MADQSSNKTGAVRDDELKRETQDELKANRALRPEEADEPEPAGEDQPVAERLPSGQEGGVPPGMTRRDVDVRSELARHLERGIFPAARDELLDTLGRHQAPDALADLVRELPAGQEYTNVQDVMRALGYGVEDHRV